MPYEVKVVVHAPDDPQILRLVRQVIEEEPAQVLKLTLRRVDSGTKEVHLELHLEDLGVMARILARIERAKGVAVMAATNPKPVPSSKRGRP